MRFYHAAIAVVILGLLQVLGAEVLYETWLWFDAVMHFLGGVVAAVIGLWLWDTWVKQVTLTSKSSFAKRVFFTICIVSFGALVGIAWEWFEYIFNHTVTIPGPWGFGQPSIGDTMADLACDMAGAFAVTLFRKKV